MGKKIFKITLWSLLGIIGLIFLIVLGYFIYLSAQYYRIADDIPIKVNTNLNNSILLKLETEYSISTYNIGFGAYSPDFSLFMDEGIMQDGTKTKGTYSRAKSKEIVESNTNGIIDEMQELNTDFMFFQEVDVKADRSHNVDQMAMISNAFAEQNNTFAFNFHSGFLCYPIFNPIGSANGGIAILSKYKVENAIRKSLPINTSFLEKFFDLDRCLLINRLKIENSDKELVLINLHLTAFDGNGEIREQQFNTLNTLLKKEREKGNYVIAGGDFNYDIANSCGEFLSQQKKCPWIQNLPEDIIETGYNFATTKNAPTCRGSDIPYTEGVNYLVVVDGFIYSDNIVKISVENINKKFLHSDHNPVKFIFKLKNIQ